jgi:protein-tyrosine phosphatase
MHRAATLVIAYMMRYHDMPLTSALDFVKQARSIIEPDLFMDQLVKWEHMLHATCK